MTPVSLRIALRELRGGFRGFWIYMACIAIGAMAVASAGSVTEVFRRGLAAEARTLLGGDVMFRSAQRTANDEERAFLNSLGSVTETAAIDVMGAARGVRRQVDVRAVDAVYPLIGEATLFGFDGDLQSALARQTDGIWGAVVSRSLLEAFDLEIGDDIQLGPLSARISARLDGTPDRIGAPGAFSPAAMVALDSLVESGRLTDGQIFRSGYRIVLDTPIEPDTVRDQFEETFGEGRMIVDGPEESVDGLQALMVALNDFLSLVGVAALIAGGVGVAQATRSFLETRIEPIAVLKTFGGDAATLRAAYGIQLALLALVGASLGAALGAATPYVLEAVAGDRIPIPTELRVFPAPVLKALGLGVLAAMVFAAPALGRARATPPSHLFRSVVDQSDQKTPWLERGLAFVAAIALALVAALTSGQPFVTLALLAGAFLVWLGFAALGRLIRFVAHLSASSASGAWRMALSNLGGPGSLAPLIAPALGLGLSVLVLVAAVQTNLLRQISQTAPSRAPDLVFSQIPHADVERFDAAIASAGVDLNNVDRFRRAPFLLGRVVGLRGQAVDKQSIAPSEQWVVENEIALTFLADQPPETDLVEGVWWRGPPGDRLQVSVEQEAARGLGLAIGDIVKFRVFGREFDAEVSSLRRVDWGAFGIGSNAAFILSPGFLEAANPFHVAIARISAERERELIDALGAVLPDVVVFQTRPALETAARLFADISVAVNAAAGLVTVSGLLVLIGAFAAMTRIRAPEAALLKVFGAQRHEILGLYAMEFAAAAAAAAVLGAAIGLAGAYPIVVNVFEAQWSLPWRLVGGIIGAASIAAAAGGAVMGLATLSRPPLRTLRR